jgi:hypothetical protein
MESVWNRIGNIVIMAGFDKRNTRNRWGAGISYSRPIWASFSATERFISSTGRPLCEIIERQKRS